MAIYTIINNKSTDKIMLKDVLLNILCERLIIKDY